MSDDDFSLCVLTNARKAARAVSRYYDQMARKAGFTSGQFSVLVTVREHDGATTAELAERLSMERTTLVRNVALLEKKGFPDLTACRRCQGQGLQHYRARQFVD
jgi:DNA-binding MarR family transcriptional regulator